jgi:hypothetical protein
MILERTDSEIVIRLSSTVDVTELQDMLDYLKYKELTALSKATKSDVEKLSKIANKNIWSIVKEKRNIK